MKHQQCLSDVIIYSFFVLLNVVLAQDPFVNIRQGRIVGIKTYSKNSLTPIEIYLGIPYAVPPVGRYRFSAPEKHPGWSRTFFAHRMPPRCPQLDDGTSDNYSEDCLFLNIWTPRHTDGSPLPVLVILYSESWTQGGINLPCQELAAEGFIIVTISYRLHLLSFFNLNDLTARGNLALLDQYLAMLWVRENIAAFGGDPKAITLFGHSAGADSVLYHLSSPRASGLFQKAIVMSPQFILKALDSPKDVTMNETEKASREIASLLGCNPRQTIPEILTCMRGRSLQEITSLYLNASLNKYMQPSPDIFLPATEQYLPKPLSISLSTTKQYRLQVDILLGTTDLEAVNYNDETFLELIKKNSTFLNSYLENRAIPEILNLFSFEESNDMATMIQAVRWEFQKPKRKSDKRTLDALEMLFRMESSGKWSAGSALLAARLARQVTGLYVYRYAHPAHVDLYGRLLNFTGAAHGADLISLLGDALLLQVARKPTSSEDTKISSHFRNLIVNFIKFGSPTTENIWPRYRAGDGYMHDIPDADNDNNYYTHGINRESAFWLQYLPQLLKTMVFEKTEQFTADNGESRLRGGVFAMCAVTVVLLLLLCICAVLLRRARAFRSYDPDDETPKTL